MNDTTKKSAISATITNRILELEFANGALLKLDAGNLLQSIQDHALMHGLKQKLVDAAAISRNTETGRAASIADKYEAVKAVYDRLLAGAWNATREGGVGAPGGLLFKALCRMYEKKTPEQLRVFLDGKTKQEQAALRASPKIAAIIEEIRAEQVKPDASIDTDELLGELDD